MLKYSILYRSIPAETLAKYTRSLKRCCESEEFTEDDRKSLRRFRLANNISYRRHLTLLKQLGWTADQYEAGTKTVENLTAADSTVGADVGDSSPRVHKHKESQQSQSEDGGFYYAKRLYNFFSTGNPNTPPSSNNLSLTGNTVATSRTASPIRSRTKHVHFDDEEASSVVKP